MKQVEWSDERGRKFISRLENHEPDDDAPLGILIGPPDIVDGLGLPEETATILHNQLFARKLWTLKDIQKQPQQLIGALQAALGVNVQKIMSLYAEYEKPTD